MRQSGYTVIELIMAFFLFVIAPMAVGVLIVRVVGIFIPPIGAVVGYL